MNKISTISPAAKNGEESAISFDVCEVCKIDSTNNETTTAAGGKTFNQAAGAAVNNKNNVGCKSDAAPANLLESVEALS